ncbi:PDZ domain-containing protein GIPC1 [Lonchura striata]|uniref:PDZ domain-containing protein GIPC1 n=1 Tax=Lonchura striata TaxID=40157 RepID=A0A218UBC6_9PASE|nr:PDZ domain-containing protein GIPC1 [Lonchura striata domestica]
MTQRIRAGSLMSRVPLVAVGDVLEALDGRSLVGARHFEVARLLQELPRGQRFRLRLTEPRRAWGGYWEGLGGTGRDWEGLG